MSSQQQVTLDQCLLQSIPDETGARDDLADGQDVDSRKRTASMRSTGSLSSMDGDTPTKPPKGKAARRDTPEPGVDATANLQKDLTKIMTTMREIRDEQRAMRKSLTQKIDNSVSQLKDSIDTTRKELRDYIDIEMSRITDRMDKMDKRLQQLESDMATRPRHENFDPAVSIIAINMRQTDDEDILAKVNRLVKDDLGFRDMDIQRCERTQRRDDGKPSVVRIQLSNVEDKVKILRSKQELKKSKEFRKTYLKSAKSHEERLIENNFKAILQDLPEGARYKFTGSGRLIKDIGPRNRAEDLTDNVNGDENRAAD